MRRTGYLGKTAALIIALSLLPACLYVKIDRHVRDPRPYFDRALSEIREIERTARRRGYDAEELCVLAYDGRDGELIQAEVPLGLVRGAIDAGLDSYEHDRTYRKWTDRHRLDRRDIRRLRECRPGLVLDIDEDRDRILVWMR